MFPDKGPIHTIRFPEGKLVMKCNEIILSLSERRSVCVDPGTEDHKRLNDMLIKYYKNRI